MNDSVRLRAESFARAGELVQRLKATLGQAFIGQAQVVDEVLAERRTLQVKDRAFIEFLNQDFIGVDILIWIFAIVAVVGWIILNRTTFGRRTVAIGGNRDSVARQVEKWAEAGVDQMVFMLQAGNTTHDAVMRSIELIGERVIPRFA